MKFAFKIPIFTILILLLFFWTCKGPSRSTSIKKQNYNYLYNPSSSSLHPSVQVFHSNDSISELVIKLFPEELLFNKANTEGIMRAYVTVKLELHEITDKKNLLTKAEDSVSFDYTIDKDETDKRYYISSLFKAYRGKNYYLTCGIRDNNRNAYSRKYIYVNKADQYNYQNFRVTYERTNQLVFDPKITGDEMLRITYSDSTVKKLYVKYYNSYQTSPPPVYMILSEPQVYNKYDSIYTIEFDKYLLFETRKEGMYLLQPDTSIEEGLTLLRFYEGFPKVSEEEQLARPLVYLESDIRYKEMFTKKNMKLTVDEFWLNLASDNIERARQLIRIYYNRVFFANYYFTSHKEGWLTDRGMVFIIYGQPDMINKDYLSERWIYLGEKMKKIVEFYFVKEDNAFGDNHFVLQRSEINTYWKEAINSWQNGLVFSVDNIRK